MHEYFQCVADVFLLMFALWVVGCLAFCTAVWREAALEARSESRTLNYTAEDSEGPQEASTGDCVEVEE